MVPGEPVDLKVSLDNLDLKFSQLDKIQKAELTVTNMQTKESENVTFTRKNDILTALEKDRKELEKQQKYLAEASVLLQDCEQQIKDTKTKQSKNTSEINSAKKQQTALDSKLKSLQTQKAKEKNASKKEAINKQIASIQSQQKKLNTKINSLNKEKTNLQKELTEANDKKKIATQYKQTAMKQIPILRKSINDLQTKGEKQLCPIEPSLCQRIQSL